MGDTHAADVQAELQQYLNSKNINALFISIVESLLIEKPSNPIGFIVEYLFKQYPDQAKEALDIISKQYTVPSNITQLPRVDPRPSDANRQRGSESKASNESKPIADSKSNKIEPTSDDKKGGNTYDSDSDDDDDIADIPERSIEPPVHSNARRASVSAESTNPNQIKELIDHIPNYPKSSEVTTELYSTINHSFLLKTLDSEQKDLIVKAFQGPIYKREGEDIIKQGEIGDVFFLLDDGIVDVYVNKQNNETKVHTYKSGDSFGELAILYNTPRAATCRAQSDCKLWTLDRVSFKAIIVAKAMQKRELYEAFLKQVPILSSLTDNELLTLADSLAEEKYSNGSVICKQGDVGNFFYIIKEGAAVCTQSDGTNEGEVGTLSIGNYFGEIALLTSKPRQATVTAVGELVVLAVDEQLLQEYLDHLILF
eukprot:CAMPEP_0196764792 /NCGR_PEP_ID=MMETSP1095-20130614/6857_1 /TAXON_ID=96789 ORGANISM="Chromulina nebulosa, Strain UTEXLB2642" /NCGR_SAMPLE_ID=MMETSP1095 /ASSEMBLY_ACC=CAM_ASM_000446 /LENGTH=426 /DNA_ID=CAMNT_0042121243 /DNA_START=110 /DNA_END=1391 /DNA_ORIENTATION=+